MRKNIAVIALVMMFSLGILGQTKSVYTGTTVKDCKPTKESSDGGYVGRCKGIGGYSLILMEGDLRQTINVITPSKKEIELNLWSTVSSGFSSVGEKVEWRLKGKTPRAFIVRFKASENPDDSSILTSYLVVVKLMKNSACIVDIVKPSTTQNVEARKSADAAGTKSCLAFDMVATLTP